MMPFKAYLAALARENGLTGEKDQPRADEIEWLFYPGMLQESCSKWWSDFGTRATCHEGIDICFYRTGPGPVSSLPPGARVPAMAPGKVLNISADLLGRSLVVSCPEEAQDETVPVMVYSHLDVAPDLLPGNEIDGGEVIGRTFDTRLKNSKLLSHLHISCICLPRGLAAEEMNWGIFADRTRVFHLNPIFLV